MNKVFLAALKGTDRDFVDSDGRIAAFNPPPKVPGTIPAHVNPPREVADNAPTGSLFSGFSLASSESKPARSASVQVASAAPAKSSGGFFSNLFGSKEEAPPPRRCRSREAEGRRQASAEQAGADRDRIGRREEQAGDRVADCERENGQCGGAGTNAGGERGAAAAGEQRAPQRRGSDRAVVRVRKSLRRLALRPDRSLPAHRGTRIFPISIAVLSETLIPSA